MTEEDALPSFAERRALFGQAHGGVIPETRDRAESAPGGLQEFLHLWAAILEAQSDPEVSSSALAGALEQARDLGSANDFRGRAELLEAAAKLLDQLKSGEPLDEEATVAQMESLASYLGTDFALALSLHMQFQREARESIVARAKAAAEAEAATAALLAKESSDLLDEQKAKWAAEQASEAAALALHAAQEADAAAEMLARQRLKDDEAAALALDLAQRQATTVKGWLLKAESSVPKGFVRVAGAQIGVEATEGPFRFYISPGDHKTTGAQPNGEARQRPPSLPAGLERVGRRLQLEATSREELEVWVQALRKVATTSPIGTHDDSR